MAAPGTVDGRMDFRPVKGWMRNGPDYDQRFEGWVVYAHKPDFPATPVEIRPITEGVR